MAGFDVAVLCLCSFVGGMALEAYRDKWAREAMEPYRPKDEEDDAVTADQEVRDAE